MRQIRWDDAFPPVDEGFARGMDRAFEAIRKEKRVKHKSRVTLLLAAALVLALAGTAIAVNEQMGILDMMKRSNRNSVNSISDEGNEKNLQAAVEMAVGESVSTSQVRYTPQQVIMDSSSMSVTVLCEALDPERVMVVPYSVDVEKGRCTQGGDVLPLDSVYEPSDYPAIAEYAVQMGKRIVRSNVYYDDDFWSDGCEYTMQNGQLVQLMKVTFEEAMAPEADGKYHAVFHVKDWWKNDGEDQYENQYENEEQVIQISAEGRAQDARETYTVSGPIEMEYLTIDEVKFERTPQALFMTVTYTGHEDLTPEQCGMMNFSSIQLMNDAESTKFREGPLIDGIGEMEQIQSKELPEEYDPMCDLLPGYTYRSREAYAPISEWPEAFYLRFYIKELGEWSEPVEIPVTFD